MSMITIDETRCKKDKFCVNDCPAMILRQDSKDTVPYMVEGGEQICLLCGHCVAACPHDAFIHRDIPMEESPKIEKDLVISPEAAIQFLRSRRSIRRFKDKPVENKDIEALISNARYAPTGGNTQLVNWTVHTDKARMKTIADLTIQWMKDVLEKNPSGFPPYFPGIVMAYDAGMNSITRDAPCLIIASTTGRHDGGKVDLTIALTYLELIAASQGLGTLWLGLITRALEYSKPLQDAVGLPDGHTHFYAMVLGHPKVKYHRVPERKPAKIHWK